MMEEVEDPQVLDVGMIVGAQKVEHYEIAGYGALVALATQLGHADAAKLLSQTLAEEKAADSKLNELALSVVNKDAADDEGAVAEAPDAPGSEARQHEGRLSGILATTDAERRPLPVQHARRVATAFRAIEE